MLYFLAHLLLGLNHKLKPPTIRVAVIDTGLNVEDERFESHLCSTGHSDFTGFGLQDDTGHGTHVAGTIVMNTRYQSYCLIILKWFSYSIPTNKASDYFYEAMVEARRQKADIINISAGGMIFSQREYDEIKNNPQTTYVVAAGNDGQGLDDATRYTFYPASYKLPNIVVVGALSVDGKSRYPHSNYGKDVVFEKGQDVISYLPNELFCPFSWVFNTCQGPMSGSSAAVPRRTARLIDDLGLKFHLYLPYFDRTK